MFNLRSHYNNGRIEGEESGVFITEYQPRVKCTIADYTAWENIIC